MEFSPFFALLWVIVGRRVVGVFVLVQAILLDIVDDCVRKQVPNRETSSQEKANLGTRYIVLNQLRDEIDVVLPSGKAVGGLIHTRASTLYDQATVASQNMLSE